MKKLLFIILMLIPLVCASQIPVRIDTVIYVPVTSVDTSLSLRMGSRNPVSIEFNYSNLDGVDTLYLYGTNNPDSSALSPVWVDLNLDGSNDNPWTLTDSLSVPPIWSEAWPWEHLVATLKTGTSTAGLKLYVNIRKY